MRFGIKTLDDFNLNGKTVLCRVDMNQPVDRSKGTLKSINRIQACVPTIQELADAGARVVLMAHQGSDIEYKNYYTTKPHAAVLSKLLNREVKWIDDVCGPAAREAISKLQDGEILLLDNVRFVAEEQTLFETKLRLSHEQQAKTLLVEKLAPLADLYVCDAFAAAHSDQPSLCGFEQEYCTISQLMNDPKRPCVFILGGAKIADAFLMMQTVLSRGVADSILTGGLVANIFLTALGENIGKGSVDYIIKSNYGEFIDLAKELYAEYSDQIILPVDLAWTENGMRSEALLEQIPENISAVDIGSQTAEVYRNRILEAGTVFVNGPMGVFEQAESELGTRTVWEAIAETGGFSVLGGGDSITATEKFGLTDKMDYVCTGGGALIRFLSGEELPVVRALRHGASIPEGGDE